MRDNHMAEKVEILEGLVKSPNDTREYRVIRLQNGFTALLISNPGCHDDNVMPSGGGGDSFAVHMSDSEEDKSGSDGDSDDDEESREGDAESEAATDSEEEDDVELPAKTHKTHSEKLSAAALCVGVGSFSDPPDLPGLSHFLEHMVYSKCYYLPLVVFMGSEKYPDENDFDAYVKRHGGSSNAFTECERTVFYFDVKRAKFSNALDRFAQFFVKPLMKQDSLDRELKAVDSEFDMSLTSDSSRKEQLQGSWSWQGHPMGKFMWGNSTSLKTIPEEKGIDVYTRLHDYRRRMYSSHFMTLAVESKEPLDNLEQLVSHVFSHVPNNHLPQPEFSDTENPFDTPEFYKMYKVVPVRDRDSVELTWSFPSHLKLYKVRPLNYVSWLVGHEGGGSILSYLKEKLWATSVYSGNGGSGFEYNSIWTSFSVEITLTEAGMNNLKEVVAVVFQYMAMLRDQGPQERVYNEIKTIADNGFRWIEKCEPVDYVETLCENMHLYPVRDYLTGHRLLDPYHPEKFPKLLAECMERFSPEKANIYLKSKKFTKEFEGKETLKETWYQTEYTMEDVPQDWLQLWKRPGTNHSLHIPIQNDYIATDFTLREPSDSTPQFPVLISDNDQGKLWYKPDNKFKVPKAYVKFAVTCPIINSSAKNLVMFDLYQNILEHNFAELAYAAEAAYLSYGISGTEYDFTIKVSGFNQKLPKLFETLVDMIAKFDVTENLFDTMKTDLHKSLYNQYTKPSTLAREVRLSILQRPYWNLLSQQRALHSVTFNDLCAFAQYLFSGVFLFGLAQGNLSPEEALNMENYIISKLGCSPHHEKSLPEVVCTSLPIGAHYSRVVNLNPTDCNSVLTNYYQHGLANIKESVLNQLLMLHMEEPVFDILRTREQLGYSVFCLARDTSGILGFSITVASQANKLSMEEINDHVENFLDEFGTNFVYNLTDEDFSTLVNSMVTLKKCEDHNLGEESSRNWREITQRTFLFDRLEKEITALHSLSVRELQDWYRHLVPSGGKSRKLSVQVVGNLVAGTVEAKETPSVVLPDSSVNSQQVELTFLDFKAEPKNNAICDFEAFCRKHDAYPVSRIM